MEYREREELFNAIMKGIRERLYELLELDKHKKLTLFRDNRGFIPLLSYNPITKMYRFNCYCLDCPNNIQGLCATEFSSIPINLLHEFDGDNILKNFCG